LSAEPIVYIVDDDPALRDGIGMLLESVSIRSRVFAGAEELMSSGVLQDGRTACLLADVRMPGISGMTLLERLREAGVDIPTIVITAYADIPMAVRAMKLGAVDFITKPLDPQAVIELVQKTLDQAANAPASDRAELLQRIETLLTVLSPRTIANGRSNGTATKASEAVPLSARHRQVLGLLAEGRTAADIAERLTISKETVTTHRRNLMRKLGLRNKAELIRYAIEHDIQGTD
jgi:FixJ family two-component response regulator